MTHLISQTEFNQKYKLNKVLGKGAYGKVYSGIDKATNMVVAIKEFFAEKDSFDRVFSEFKHEWDIMSNLDHPNLVKYYDYYRIEDKDKLYLIMSYIKGDSMENLDISDNYKQLWIVAKDLFSALSYMHKNSIAHRDVKPANIMIKPDGHAILVDYGFSCLVNFYKKNDLKCPHTGWSGSPDYMSPEIFNINKENYGIVFYSNDVWSSGMSLYELYYGYTYNDTNQQIKECTKNCTEKTIKFIKSINKPIIKDARNIYEEFIDYALIINYKDRPTAQECYETVTDIIKRT